MSQAVVSLALRWGPVLLSLLPKIIEFVKDMYATWSEMKSTDQEKDSVMSAMKLLNKFKDNIKKLLQDPGLKKILLEGLTCLISRIISKGRGQTQQKMISPCPALPSPQDKEPCKGGDNGASYSPRSCSRSSPSSFSKSSNQGVIWKECDVCRCSYNLTNRRPTILICGHTFCRECLGNVRRRGALQCPVCRTIDSRPLDALPSNTNLIMALEEDQDDDVCCSGGGGGGKETFADMTMTFEQQIEYAIFLSQQEAQTRGAAYVEASWREVLEAEDEMLARAIHESELYEASRQWGQQEAEDAKGSMCPPDKVEWEEYGACGGGQTEPASPGWRGEDDEASLQLALELHQQEVADMQRQCSSGSNGSSSCCVASSCGAGRRKEHQDVLRAKLCGPVDKESGKEQEERREEKAEIGKKKEEHKDEEYGAVCCSMNQEEEKDTTQEDGCERKCNEDDCTKKGKEQCSAEYSAFLRDEEELLIQMAICASLQELEGCTPALTVQE